MKKPPATLAAATALLGHYAQVDAQLTDVEASRQAAIALVNTDADADVVRLTKELEEIAARLQPWWDANGAELAKGKKSAELGGCKIGYKKTGSKLVHGFADDDKALAALRTTPLFNRLTKVKHSLNRAAIEVALGAKGQAAAILDGLGFKVAEGSDRFFVVRSKTASDLAG